MTLHEKIAASLHQGLHIRPERPAGLCHGGPQVVGHHLHDLGFVNIPLKNAADVKKGTVGNQAAWTCRMVMSMPHTA